MWRATALLTGLMASIGVSSAHGQLVRGRDVLRGLTGVDIIVVDPGSEAAQYGLSESRLQTVTELVLRSAGIRVATFETQVDSLVNPEYRMAYLGVTVFTMKGNDGLYAYRIDVRLNELMRFVDGSGTANGVTWSRGLLGTTGRNNLRDLADKVRDLVEEFANDYLAAQAR